MKNYNLKDYIYNSPNLSLYKDSRKKNYLKIEFINDNTGIGARITSIIQFLPLTYYYNFIPVIDLNNHLYFNNNIKCESIWNLFFKKPYSNNIELDSNIISTKNKKIFNNNIFINHKYSLKYHDFNLNEKYIQFWNIQFNKYIQFRDEILQIVNDFFNDLNIHKYKILGLLVRGTDIIGKKDHPIQPSTSQLIKEIEQLNSIEYFDKIIVMSEDLSRRNIVKNHFENVIFLDNYTFSKSGEYIVKQNEFKKNGYEITKRYLANLIILSRLDYIISGLCSGTICLNLFKKPEHKFKYFKIINNGFY